MLLGCCGCLAPGSRRAKADQGTAPPTEEADFASAKPEEEKRPLKAEGQVSFFEPYCVA